MNCGYAPEVFRAFQRLRERAQSASPEDYIFTGKRGQPLSQEWLNERIWKPTLVRAGIRVRGQYCIRDTFISLALSSGEDPGWVAQVCGTSEQMIFRHYRHWIPALQTGAGSKVKAIVGKLFRRENRVSLSPKPSPSFAEVRKSQQPRGYSVVREGGLEPPRGCPHKVLSLARLPFRHSRNRQKSFIWPIRRIQAGTTARFGATHNTEMSCLRTRLGRLFCGKRMSKAGARSGIVH